MAIIPHHRSFEHDILDPHFHVSRFLKHLIAMKFDADWWQSHSFFLLLDEIPRGKSFRVDKVEGGQSILEFLKNSFRVHIRFVEVMARNLPQFWKAQTNNLQVLHCRHAECLGNLFGVRQWLIPVNTMNQGHIMS